MTAHCASQLRQKTSLSPCATEDGPAPEDDPAPDDIIDIVGSLCYADDIALLAPSPSALRILLRERELFASDHNLSSMLPKPS